MLKFLEKNVGIILIVGIILTMISPFLLTRNSFWINFTQTGEIGSTIGGITAPITGILGAVLIFFALNAQRKANIIQSENNEIQLLLTLIMDL